MTKLFTDDEGNKFEETTIFNSSSGKVIVIKPLEQKEWSVELKRSDGETEVLVYLDCTKEQAEALRILISDVMEYIDGEIVYWVDVQDKAIKARKVFGSSDV